MRGPTERFPRAGQKQVAIPTHRLKPLCVRALASLLLLEFNYNLEAMAAESPPQFEWARQVQGSWLIQGDRFCLDGSGNAYQSGRAFGDTVLGDTVFTNLGTFIVKYDRAGSTVWATQDALYSFSPDPFTTFEGVHAVAVANGFYAASSIRAPANFGGQTVTNPPGFEALVLTKHDTDGAPIWAKVVCWAGFAGPTELAADAFGNAYLVGFAGTSVSTTTTNVSGTTTFLAKCDPDGNVPWIKGFDCGDPYRGIEGLAVDKVGNVVVAGSYEGDLAIDGTILTNAGQSEMFVAKFDNAGQLLWAKRAGGLNDNYWNRLAISPAGDIFLTGEFLQSVSFDSVTLSNSQSDSVYFVAKYDTDGNAVWARQLCLGGSRSDVAVDAMGNCFVATECNADANITFAKYDPEGNLLWSKPITNTFAPNAALILGDLHADAVGNCYVSGTLYASSASFDSITVTNNDAYTDVFLAKFGTSAAPPLDISREGGNLQFHWSVLATGFYLESATEMTDSTLWLSNAVPSTVVGQSNIVTIQPSEQRRFFRLRRP